MRKALLGVCISAWVAGGPVQAGFSVPRHVKAPAELESVMAEAEAEGKSVMIVRSDPGTN